MTSTRHSRLIILGSGPAGYAAAVYAARANRNPVLITGVEQGGQLMTTTDVDNWPGDVEGLQGPALMQRMLEHAQRFATEIVVDHIEQADLSSRPFVLTSARTRYSCDALIIATGASARYLGLPSEDKFRGRGVSACATCDGFFFRDKEIAVVGGGDTALEEALFLTRFATRVHLLHRRDLLRGSRIMIDRAIAHPKIEIHLNTSVEEVLGESHVEGLRLRRTDSGEGQDMALDGLFIAIGYKPNTDLFREILDVDEMGYLTVRDETGSRIEGIFIAGDVHDHRYRQAITAAGEGCKAAIDAERWLEMNGRPVASALAAKG